jgi:hypothetical protein
MPKCMSVTLPFLMDTQGIPNMRHSFELMLAIKILVNPELYQNLENS